MVRVCVVYACSVHYVLSLFAQCLRSVPRSVLEVTELFESFEVTSCLHVFLRSLSLSLYIYIYICIYRDMYIYIYISLSLPLSLYIYIYIYTYICSWLHILSLFVWPLEVQKQKLQDVIEVIEGDSMQVRRALPGRRTLLLSLL